MKIHHVLGGGTVFHVRPHLALSAPAYGETARRIAEILERDHGERPVLHLTRMAGGRKDLETNADVARLLDELIQDRNTGVIYMSAAPCDFEGSLAQEAIAVSEPWSSAGPLISDGVAGKHLPRLRSDRDHYLELTPAAKVINKIRKSRKDIFLVGFKTTAGFGPQAQYEAGLTLLKKASCNLVLANDVHTRHNMVITPEQARYHETVNRDEALSGLVDMAVRRSKLRFTRSTVVDGEPIPWLDERIPQNLRTVVDYCIEAGCYKPFLGSTVGHFAVKLGPGRFLTSRRKTNFNNLYAKGEGLVFVELDGDDQVIAHGSRPSVGGQSQRIVFAEHPDTDCIVHFHGKLKPDSTVPVRSQRGLECGSHECGQNTSSGLQRFGIGAEQHLYAVMLDKHGPNVVFGRHVDPELVQAFITQNFQLGVTTDAFP